MSRRQMKSLRSAVAAARERRAFRKMVERYHAQMDANGGGWVTRRAVFKDSSAPATEHRVGNIAFTYRAL